MKATEILFERNVINTTERYGGTESIDEFVADLAQRATTDSTRKWITSNLRRYLINSYPRATDVTHAVLQALHSKDFRTLPQWMQQKPEQAAAQIEKDPVFAVQIDRDFHEQMLSVVDFLNTVRERQIRMSVPDAISHAERYHANLEIASLREIDPGEDWENVKEIMRFKDGLRIVQLLSPKCLDRESQQLGHCVGGGGYDAGVKAGTIHIFSLRNNQNKSFATVEVRNQQVLQIKSTGNAPPPAEMWDHIRQFIRQQQFGIERDGRNVGLTQRGTHYYADDEESEQVLRFGDGVEVHHTAPFSGSTERDGYYSLRKEEQNLASFEVRNGAVVHFDRNAPNYAGYVRQTIRKFGLAVEAGGEAIGLLRIGQRYYDEQDIEKGKLVLHLLDGTPIHEVPKFGKTDDQHTAYAAIVKGDLAFTVTADADHVISVNFFRAEMADKEAAAMQVLRWLKKPVAASAHLDIRHSLKKLGGHVYDVSEVAGAEPIGQLAGGEQYTRTPAMHGDGSAYVAMVAQDRPLLLTVSGGAITVVYEAADEDLKQLSVAQNADKYRDIIIAMAEKHRLDIRCPIYSDVIKLRDLCLPFETAKPPVMENDDWQIQEVTGYGRSEEFTAYVMRPKAGGKQAIGFAVTDNTVIDITGAGQIDLDNVELLRQFITEHKLRVQAGKNIVGLLDIGRHAWASFNDAVEHESQEHINEFLRKKTTRLFQSNGVTSFMANPTDAAAEALLSFAEEYLGREDSLSARDVVGGLVKKLWGTGQDGIEVRQYGAAEANLIANLRVILAAKPDALQGLREMGRQAFGRLAASDVLHLFEDGLPESYAAIEEFLGVNFEQLLGAGNEKRRKLGLELADKIIRHHLHNRDAAQINGVQIFTFAKGGIAKLRSLIDDEGGAYGVVDRAHRPEFAAFLREKLTQIIVEHAEDGEIAIFDDEETEDTFMDFLKQLGINMLDIINQARERTDFGFVVENLGTTFEQADLFDDTDTYLDIEVSKLAYEVVHSVANLFHDNVPYLTPYQHSDLVARLGESLGKFLTSLHDSNDAIVFATSHDAEGFQEIVTLTGLDKEVAALRKAKQQALTKALDEQMEKLIQEEIEDQEGRVDYDDHGNVDEDHVRDVAKRNALADMNISRREVPGAAEDFIDEVLGECSAHHEWESMEVPDIPDDVAEESEDFDFAKFFELASRHGSQEWEHQEQEASNEAFEQFRSDIEERVKKDNQDDYDMAEDAIKHYLDHPTYL